MTTGQRIAEQRKKCGYSQIYVADKLNVSRQAVSRWEMDAAAPDTYNLIALAELLGVTVEYITLGRETVSATTVEPSTVSPKKNNSRLLNIILITLAVWLGSGVLLLFIFSWRRSWVWSELEVLILLSLIITPLPFAMIGNGRSSNSEKGIMLRYLTGFVFAVLVSGINFLQEFAYIVSEHSLSVFKFNSWDRGGAYSFIFLGLTLIQMAVVMPVFSWKKLNILGRILMTFLSAPVVLLIGSGSSEWPNFSLYYVNRWWWTAVCALLYFAVGLIHWLIVKKCAKNLDTAASDRV